MRVTITIECNVADGSTEREIEFTLMDALAEFQSARHHNGESYVNRRYAYPGNPYTGERREMKIRQVNRRIAIAEKMRCGIKTIVQIPDDTE